MEQRGNARTNKGTQLRAATTIELPDDVLAQARELAQTANRRMEDVLADAVAQGLTYDRWFRAEVEEALRSTRAGHFAPPEDVAAL